MDGLLAARAAGKWRAQAIRQRRAASFSAWRILFKHGMSLATELQLRELRSSLSLSLSLCVCVCVRPGLFIKNRAQPVTIKSEAQAIVLRKQRNFWFSLTAVGPNAAEFFLINSTVFCCFQFTLDLSQEFSHLPPPQSVPRGTLLFRKPLANWLYLGPDKSAGKDKSISM